MKKSSWTCSSFAALLLAGCGAADTCSDFPKTLGEPISKIHSLPVADADGLPVSAAKTLIKSCYPKAPYAISGYRMIEPVTKQLGDSEYILTYAFDGISDVRIAFRITGAGRVSSVFEISTL
ncbi:MAG: hypothetical protein J7499_16995 [Sphingopyxis sp.]|nr:hypothetical protein [Sphingopyxis sp.]